MGNGKNIYVRTIQYFTFYYDSTELGHLQYAGILWSMDVNNLRRPLQLSVVSGGPLVPGGGTRLRIGLIYIQQVVSAEDLQYRLNARIVSYISQNKDYTD